MEQPPSHEPLLLPPSKASAQAMRPLWRDLILSVWGADLSSAPAARAP